MTKQEEIREGISQGICRICFDVTQEPVMSIEECRKEGICALNTDETIAHLNLLHSQGVVIKVERELPLNPHLVEVLSGFGKAAEIYYKAQQRILKAGYVAVEPLIIEAKVK